MSIQPDDTMSEPRRGRAPFASGFMTFAILTTAVGVIGLVIGLARLGAGQGPIRATEVAGLAALVVASLAGVGLMIAAGTVTRQLQCLSRQTANLCQQMSVLAEQSVADHHGGATDGVIDAHLAAEEIRKLLLDIRETLLLPQEQRTWRYGKLVESAFRERLAAAEKFVRAREFHRARQELGVLSERFGADERIRQAQDKLECAAEEARASDITQAKSRVEDLIALGSWDNALRVAQELAQKYPLAQEAADLLDRVRSERDAFMRKHRQRMHDDIQTFVSQRRWSEALEATRLFIEAFPTGEDTDALRMQLPTLESNSEIQSRQRLEKQFKEHIAQQQYWDALALARRIIGDYPLSPQANALRGQLARLEELARKTQS